MSKNKSILTHPDSATVSQSSAVKQKSKRGKTVLATLIAVISIPAVLVYTQAEIDNQPESIPLVEYVSKPKVTTRKLQLEAYQGVVNGYAEVTSAEKLHLVSQVSGRVTWKNPALVQGGKVKKGELLVKLDDSRYQLNLARAQKELADARLALMQEEKRSRQAAKDWHRSGLTQEPSRLALRKPQLSAATMRLKVAQAQVSNAKNELNDTKVTAPFDGVINTLNIATGSYLNSGSPITTMTSTKQAEIQLALTEQEWQKLGQHPQGRAVTIYSVTSQKRWQGEVIRLSNTLERETRTRLLTIGVKQPLEQKEPLLFGSFVKVEVPAERREKVFVIPANSVTNEGDIWLVENDTLARYALPPHSNESGVYVISQGALPAEVQIVSKPLASYLNGMQVVTALETSL